jgi:arylsulfatase
MPERPNILLITTDEERFKLPSPPGYFLPARERVAENGVRFTNYYTASAQCSSARSVIYTGRHVPVTRIYDNDNFPYIDPLDAGLGTLGTMLGEAGYYCTYKGKWQTPPIVPPPPMPWSPTGSTTGTTGGISTEVLGPGCGSIL